MAYRRLLPVLCIANRLRLRRLSAPPYLLPCGPVRPRGSFAVIFIQEDSDGLVQEVKDRYPARAQLWDTDGIDADPGHVRRGAYGVDFGGLPSREPGDGAASGT